MSGIRRLSTRCNALEAIREPVRVRPHTGRHPQRTHKPDRACFRTRLRAAGTRQDTRPLGQCNAFRDCHREWGECDTCPRCILRWSGTRLSRTRSQRRETPVVRRCRCHNQRRSHRRGSDTFAQVLGRSLCCHLLETRGGTRHPVLRRNRCRCRSRNGLARQGNHRNAGAPAMSKCAG